MGHAHQLPGYRGRDPCQMHIHIVPTELIRMEGTDLFILMLQHRKPRSRVNTTSVCHAVSFVPCSGNTLYFMPFCEHVLIPIRLGMEPGRSPAWGRKVQSRDIDTASGTGTDVFLSR